MRLLVSVRDAEDAAAAVAGGAEIIDAKDPASASSIGAVRPAILDAIRDAVPSTIRLSAALGDVRTRDEVERAFAAIRVPLAYVKLGFRGLADTADVALLLREAVRCAGELPSRPAVIGVGYADAARLGAVSPLDLPALLYQCGADGLLIDTAHKDGGSTFQVSAPLVLDLISARCEAEELTLAVGGGLGLDDVDRASAFGATIFGVRGAVCEGGRNGPVRQDRVRALAQAIRQERARAS